MLFLAVILALSFFTILGILAITKFPVKLSSCHKICVYIPDSCQNTEYIIKKLLKKYPYAKIIISLPTASPETKKMLEIFQRKNPNIFIETK